MSFLDKVKATLASFQQRPDPNTANSDLRDEATKNMNRQEESKARDQEQMQEREKPQQETNPVGPSNSGDEA